jgi:hypothetical protein
MTPLQCIVIEWSPVSWCRAAKAQTIGALAKLGIGSSLEGSSDKPDVSVASKMFGGLIRCNIGKSNAKTLKHMLNA